MACSKKLERCVAHKKKHSLFANSCILFSLVLSVLSPVSICLFACFFSFGRLICLQDYTKSTDRVPQSCSPEKIPFTFGTYSDKGMDPGLILTFFKFTSIFLHFHSCLMGIYVDLDGNNQALLSGWYL